MQTQNEWVLEQLKAGRRITPMDALDEHGIMRLGARIHDLREWGQPIESRMVKVDNRYGQSCSVAEYYFESVPIAVPF